MIEPTPYELLGGDNGLRRLTRRFYEIMAERADATAIRHMHAGDLGPVTESLFGFLRGWTGGPRDWFNREEAPCIMGVHRRLPIGEAERDQWLACMKQALDEVGVSAEARAIVEPAFARVADAMRSL